MKHPVLWFEVLGKDSAGLCQFYASLFGWSFKGDPARYATMQENDRGIPGGVETPGLMMGLAGIGYGLLRLGATDRVPALLSREPPRCATRAGAER